MQLSVVLLLLLMLLTYLGTLEQVNSGLYEVQKKYFESLFLVHRAGPVPIPLPGATLVMALLFVNLLVGGIVRMRRKRARVGILIAHVGIAILLVSGFVKFTASDDGALTLYEGEQARHYQSHYRVELAVSRVLEDGRIEEHLVSEEQLAAAREGGSVVLQSEALPFEIELEHLLTNCRPMPKGPMFEVDVPVVDGVFLSEEPRSTAAEKNLAGAYVQVRPRAGDGPIDGLLWVADAAPLTVAIGDARWAVDLRRERYPMPFGIALETFTKENHPRSNMPSHFASDVRVLAEDGERSVAISMNEPLRDGGLVLYQASWGPKNARPGDPLYSTLAVVRNPADQWPLIACVVIAFGLLWHFAAVLMRYVRREARAA